MSFFLIFLSVICLISVVISILWLNPKFSNKIERLDQNTRCFYNTKETCLAFTIIGLSFLGWEAIYYNGFYGLLWFIPENLMVHDGEWGWVSLRMKTSFVLSIFATLYTLIYAQESLRQYQRLEEMDK